MNSFCQFPICKKLTEMKSLPEKLNLRGQSPLPHPPSSQTDEEGIPSMARSLEHRTLDYRSGPFWQGEIVSEVSVSRAEVIITDLKATSKIKWQQFCLLKEKLEVHGVRVSCPSGREHAGKGGPRGQAKTNRMSSSGGPMECAPLRYVRCWWYSAGAIWVPNKALQAVRLFLYFAFVVTGTYCIFWEYWSTID